MLTPLERHKSRILAAIKANETRNAVREYKPPRRRSQREYPLKKVRHDTYNLGEMLRGVP